jgi:hypothetical protein
MWDNFYFLLMSFLMFPKVSTMNGDHVYHQKKREVSVTFIAHTSARPGKGQKSAVVFSSSDKYLMESTPRTWNVLDHGGEAGRRKTSF